MNQNPYAPPQEQQPQAPAAWQGGGPPQPWSATNVLGMAWDRYKEYAIVASVALFVVTLIEQLPGMGVQVALLTHAIPPRGSTFQGVNLSARVIGFLVTSFLQAGVVTMTLKMARGQQPSIGDVFSGSRFFGRLLLLNFLSALAILLGFLLLIVPGVIVSLGLMLAPYYAIDQDLDAISAMKASWEGSKGQKGDLFVLSLLGALVLFAGVCVLGVGVFVAIPLVHLSTTYAYLHISGRIAPPQPPPAWNPYSGYAP